jgi:hypothetical protein
LAPWSHGLFGCLEVGWGLARAGHPYCCSLARIERPNRSFSWSQARASPVLSSHHLPRVRSSSSCAPSPLLTAVVLRAPPASSNGLARMAAREGAARSSGWVVRHLPSRPSCCSPPRPPLCLPHQRLHASGRSSASAHRPPASAFPTSDPGPLASARKKKLLELIAHLL